MTKYSEFYLGFMKTGYAGRIKSQNDAEQLRLGLAEIVLSSGDEDHRDLLLALAGLWLAAAHADIDPLPYFQAASQTASTDDPYGTGSVRDMLAYFHETAVFREGVEPNLPASQSNKTV